MCQVSNLKKRFPYLAGCIGIPSVLALLLVPPPATFSQSSKAQAGQYKPIMAQAPSGAMQTRAKEVFSKMPLSFELNQGQTNEGVRFFSRSAGHTLWLTADTQPTLTMRFGGTPQASNGSSTRPPGGTICHCRKPTPSTVSESP